MTRYCRIAKTFSRVKRGPSTSDYLSVLTEIVANQSCSAVERFVIGDATYYLECIYSDEKSREGLKVKAAVQSDEEKAAVQGDEEKEPHCDAFKLRRLLAYERLTEAMDASLTQKYYRKKTTVAAEIAPEISRLISHLFNIFKEDVSGSQQQNKRFNVMKLLGPLSPRVSVSGIENEIDKWKDELVNWRLNIEELKALQQTIKKMLTLSFDVFKQARYNDRISTEDYNLYESILNVDEHVHRINNLLQGVEMCPRISPQK